MTQPVRSPHDRRPSFLAAAAAVGLCLMSVRPTTAGTKQRVDQLEAQVGNLQTGVEASLQELRELLETIKKATPGRVCATSCIGAADTMQLSLTDDDGDCAQGLSKVHLCT